MTGAFSDACLFCRIIRGIIPSHKIYETSHSLAFLDISPLSEGHFLVIPKMHGTFLHEITDDYLADLLPTTKKIVEKCLNGDGETKPAYNILQNNGRLAHQEVEHVHFHIIPKRKMEEGLGINWPAAVASQEALARLAESYRAKLQ